MSLAAAPTGAWMRLEARAGRVWANITAMVVFTLLGLDTRVAQGTARRLLPATRDVLHLLCATLEGVVVESS